jgi:hypothetical protein
MSETAAPARIIVERWVTTYVASSSDASNSASIAGAVEGLRQRMDQFVAEELLPACAEILRARLDASSPAVWRIRELRLDLVADVLAARSARVAHAWGESFAARVSAVVTRGADSDGILCFENHGAYLAQFAIDRAAGRAGQLWYYQEFFSLQMLPAGRAIAEAFIRVPEHGAQAVLRLASENRLDEILLSLTERDAGMIRRHCFPGPEAAATSADLSRWSGRLLDLLSQEPIRATGMVQQDACDELRWIARASLRFPGAERNSAALEAIDGLLALRRVLTSIQSALADRLAHDLAEERISVEECACIALQHGARSPERGLRFLAQIGRGDPDWAAQAVGSLLREQVPAALAGHTDETMISAHGGAFLLGPILSEFNVDQIAWSACCDDRQNEARASFLRHFVLAKCVGGDRAEEVLKDPALRVLSGHHGATHWEDAEFFGPLDLARAKAALLRTIAAAAGCDGRCLLAESIRLPSYQRNVLLLRDVSRHVWLYASAWPDEARERAEVLQSAVDLVRETAGNAPHLLLRESIAMRPAEAASPEGVSRYVLSGDRIDDEIAENLSLTGCVDASTSPEKMLHLLTPCGPEFEDLVSPWAGRDIDLDIASTLLAQATLRGFAQSLKGFQATTPEYLRRNFFHGIAMLRFLPERIEVELPRTPLSLVLQMSGLDRRRYAVPWLKGREIWLLPPRE